MNKILVVTLRRFGEKFIRVSFSIPTPEVEKFAEAFPRVMEELNI